jgi:hypothetical protein
LPLKQNILADGLPDRSQAPQETKVDDDFDLTPTEAAEILGIAHALVVHRMDVGDLPFRYVGTERRTTREDVLALKSKLDTQQKAMNALAEDTEDLIRFGF